MLAASVVSFAALANLRWTILENEVIATGVLCALGEYFLSIKNENLIKRQGLKFKALNPIAHTDCKMLFQRVYHISPLLQFTNVQTICVG